MKPSNPYAAPHAQLVSDESVSIDALQVSDAWKRRFHAIAKAGGPRLPQLKTLPVSERRHAMGFNILAFLFGPLYYLAKGMWRRAISYSALAFTSVLLIDLILEALGYGGVTRFFSYGVAALFAMLANSDYFKVKVLGDNGWL